MEKSCDPSSLRRVERQSRSRPVPRMVICPGLLEAGWEAAPFSQRAAALQCQFLLRFAHPALTLVSSLSDPTFPLHTHLYS